MKIDRNELDSVTSRKLNIVRDMADLYYGQGRGSNLGTAKGTAWGAFNAVSEYSEHHKYIRGATDELDLIDRRLTSSFFGRGAQLEQRAWNAALSLTYDPIRF